MSEIGFAGVDHVAIAARDPIGLADWYCRILGFRSVFNNAKERPIHILAGAGGGMIEMLPDDESQPPNRELLNRGLSHLAIRVANLQAAIASLNAAGIEVAEPFAAMGGGMVANFRDPEGNVCQVVERPANWGP